MEPIEKVKQGLRCCSGKRLKCHNCPCNGKRTKKESCETFLMRDALSMIEQLQEEIERLKKPGCEQAEHDSGGCLGYSGSYDDEPVEACKKCKKYTGNN